ncbi:MAG TPA: phosphoribosyltransferase family protein [Candidatus Paceibacterota bacterium]|nr:phosphoribosyltransferase family protein [Candidatus Paceibacterota bacterium]
MFFENRQDAGRKLAERIKQAGIWLDGFSVIGIARGGVIVGQGVSQTFSLPLHSFSTDDCSVDGKTIFISPFGTATIWDGKRKGMFGRQFVSELTEELSKHEEVVACKSRVSAQHLLYGGINQTEIPESVIICDDGLVSGRSMISVMDTLRHAGAKNILLAVPVIPAWFPDEIEGSKVLMYRRSRSSNFATGIFYFNFDDTPDQDVIEAVGALTV